MFWLIIFTTSSFLSLSTTWKDPLMSADHPTIRSPFLEAPGWRSEQLSAPIPHSLRQPQARVCFVSSVDWQSRTALWCCKVDSY